jgi:Domain of unknown function (DUF4263)
MSNDYEIHSNKRPDRNYFSKSFSGTSNRRMRFASKVLDCPEQHHYAMEKGQLVIRVTDSGRQELVARFYEDDRSIAGLIIQRYATKTGKPLKEKCSFVDKEIIKLRDFLNTLPLVQFPDDQKFNVSDDQLQQMLLSPEQIRAAMTLNPELIAELARTEITHADVVALAYRRKQLERFERLLADPGYFTAEKTAAGHTDEALWQNFFEHNQWIFGYGLAYVHASSLTDRKLEQIIIGHDLTNSGKRSDAVMKARGAIDALCLVEIKRHTASLIESKPYRPGCWAPSDDLAGGISQVQATVAQVAKKIASKLELKDTQGFPTGETVFTYEPRSFLIIGSLEQFNTEHGPHEEQYRSFELFRRNIDHPEILTYDELLHRARFIVQHAGQ